MYLYAKDIIVDWISMEKIWIVYLFSWNILSFASGENLNQIFIEKFKLSNTENLTNSVHEKFVILIDKLKTELSKYSSYKSSKFFKNVKFFMYII